MYIDNFILYIKVFILFYNEIPLTYSCSFSFDILAYKIKFRKGCLYVDY